MTAPGRSAIVALTLTAACLAAPDRPAYADQARTADDGIGLHLDMGVESLFDGGLIQPGDTGAYGGVARGAFRFQTQPYRPGAQLEYVATVRRFHGSERWNRTSHRLSGLLGTSLGDPLHLETIGWLSLAGQTEDGDGVDEFALVPRLAWRLDRADRIRVRLGTRWRRPADGASPATIALLTRLEYRHRFGRDRSFELEYRYEADRSDDPYARVRSILGASFESRLGRHHGVILTLDRRWRHYPNRIIPVGDREATRRDRIWMPGAVWALAEDGAEFRISYRYQARSSNQPGRSYTAHRLAVELRRTIALRGPPRPLRFDADPWDIVGAPPADRPARFGTVDVGGARVCGIADGAAYCWTDRPDADVSGSDGSTVDGRRAAVGPPLRVSADARWRDVSVGQGPHGCGIAGDGRVYCWRHTDSPSVDDVPMDYPRSPVPVSDSLRFRSISVGWAHACGITTDGRAHCWGDNTHGALGDGSFEPRLRPTAVASDVPFRAISAGWRHTCALAEDGTAYCWGSNARGQLGIGGSRWAAEPHPVHGLRFRALSAGTNHTCALGVDGRAYCWGANDGGQLGNDAAASADRPAPVTGGLRFRAISAGWAHSCGIAVDGGAHCWGRNRYGQLGTGARDAGRHARPVAVASSARFHAVSASFRSCALGEQGVVFCWGDRLAGGDSPDHDPAMPFTLPAPVSGPPR